MQGYTYKEISKKIPYTIENYFSKITQELKKEGRITDEEIERARFERKEKRMMEVILEGLKRGLNYVETADFDKSLGLTEEQYKRRKRKLIESGTITEEEVKKQRKLADERKTAERKEEYEGPLDKEIIRLSKKKMSTIEVAKELGVSRSYVKKRKQKIREKAKQKRRGISKEDLENCFKKAGFPEEQIQRILNKELISLLKRGSISRINKILRVLTSYKISLEAIENSLNILVDGNPKNIEDILKLLLVEFKIRKEAIEGCLTVLSKGQENEIREIFNVLYKNDIKNEDIEGCLTILAKGKADEIKGIFEVLDEYKISKEAIERALFILARGKADNIREIFKVLKENKIEKSKVEGCLSILAAGDADEVREIFKFLKNNGIDREIISNSLYAVATGKLSEMQKIFEVFQRHSIIGANVVRNGLRLLADGKANNIEDIIVILQENGIRNEIIEEELSAICNSSTKEEVEEMFNDSKEPEDKGRHYINVRRYMKLKELYGRIYQREEIESLCVQKHLSVKEFISEVVTYPRGRDFTDMYYEKLMRDGTLYVGGSTDMDWDYQNEHGEEIIKLARRVANTFSLRTGYNDLAELESSAIEVMITKCGNLVYNLSDRPDNLKAAMFNKTLSYLYSVVKRVDTNISSLTYVDRDSSRDAKQRDIRAEDNTRIIESEEEKSLESRIDYEKAKFDDTETQVMRCMIKLVEGRRSK